MTNTPSRIRRKRERLERKVGRAILPILRAGGGRALSGRGDGPAVDQAQDRLPRVVVELGVAEHLEGSLEGGAPLPPTEPDEGHAAPVLSPARGRQVTGPEEPGRRDQGERSAAQERARVALPEGLEAGEVAQELDGHRRRRQLELVDM